MLPVLLSDPAQAAPRGTVLFLKGGPYGNLLNGMAVRATTSHLIARWGRSASIAIPAFLGVDRLRVGEGDVARARSEVEALTTALEERGDGPVCVIAFSMGAAMAAPLVVRHPHTGFLMLAPLAAAPRTFVERARALGTPAPPVHLFALSGGADIILPADAATLAYFGAELNQTMADRLGPGLRNNLRIAYADGDAPVTPSDVAALSFTLPPAAITRLPPVGHSIEDSYASSAYRPLIDSFLEECLQGGRANVTRPQ